jgi:hypothetical protein
MAFVAEDTIQALRAHGTETLPLYEAALRAACTVHPPPFGQAWYGERYRAVASDPVWLASSLVANAEKEAEGARKLWALAGRTPDTDVAEAIRRHAIDESRHALMYIAMCEIVFPEALAGEIAEHAKSLSPRYSYRDFPPNLVKALSELIVDNLIQMNIGEIRTRIHQLLMRPMIVAHCPEDRQDRLMWVLDSLLDDETRHVQYTARLIEKAAQNGRAESVKAMLAARLNDFNAITVAETGAAQFVGE